MNQYSVHLYNTVHHLYFDLKTLGISGKERKQKSDNSFHTRSLKVKRQSDRETKIMPLTLSCLSWLLTSGVKGASLVYRGPLTHAGSPGESRASPAPAAGHPLPAQPPPGTNPLWCPPRPAPLWPSA